ncbi:MAG: hypothetical protein K5855_04930 [Oscillospiraceae bacterium]|nr:hypothetical protein [Oscillospiraceae bacterium]
MKEDDIKKRGADGNEADRPRDKKPTGPDLKSAVIMSELLAPPLAKRRGRRI